MLLGGAQLGHRPGVLGARVVGDEGRVVAEAPRAPGPVREVPLAAALEQLLRAVLGDVSERADVGDPAVARPLELAQQEVQVLLIARLRARIARRANPRAATERYRLDPRVVGDRGEPRRGMGPLSLG